MINEYLINRKKRLDRKNERDNFFFGIIIGEGMALIGFVFFLKCYSSVKEIISLIITCIGIIITFISIINPNILQKFRHLFMKITGFIGKIIFNCILMILYYLLIFPIGIIFKILGGKNEEKYTSFQDYNSKDYSSGKIKGIYNILAIFRVFSGEKFFLMMPIVIILIIIGIIIAFAETSVVAPFIYTLF